MNYSYKCLLRRTWGLFNISWRKSVLREGYFLPNDRNSFENKQDKSLCICVYDIYVLHTYKLNKG